MNLPDKEIPVASGNLGVCNMDHILWEKAVRSGGGAGEEGHLVWSYLTAKYNGAKCCPQYWGRGGEATLLSYISSPLYFSF